MARVTIEDCLPQITNRFHLVLEAADRAKKLIRGAVEAQVAWENDKATVVALREIASGLQFQQDELIKGSAAEVSFNNIQED